MRTLPADLTTEINKEAFRLCHLVKIELTSSDYFYTDHDVDVWWAGQKYNARGIEFDAAQYSLLPKVDSLQFEIDNVSLEFSALVMNEETRGKKCIIYRAAIDEYVKVKETAILFPGVLDRTEINEQRASFEIVNTFIKWQTPTPRRTHSSTCPWTFKDTNTCKYTGLGSPETGTATSATSNTLTDSSKSWGTDDYKDKRVKITGGTGAGQRRVISSNTSIELTVDTDWATTPDGTSTYEIDDFCDQSYDRCLTLSNTPQFGGFRWLTSLVDKKISWGKVLQ